MNPARVFFGSVLVAIGVVLALDAADVWQSGDVFSNWWPAVLIAAALLGLISDPRHWLGPLIVGGLGTLLLLERNDVIDDGFWPVAWAVAFVLVGLAVIFKSQFARRVPESSDRISTFTAFGGTEIASHSKHFEGGTMGALFGGAELDLRDAQLAPDASLEVFAAFGGAEIRVPEGWLVTTHGIPIFGGFENITARETGLADDAPTLDVNATVLFGGLEVKH